MSTAEVFPMTDDAVAVPRMPQTSSRLKVGSGFRRAKMAHLVPFKTGCPVSRRAGIPDLPEAKEVPRCLPSPEICAKQIEVFH